MKKEEYYILIVEMLKKANDRQLERLYYFLKAFLCEGK